MEDTQLGKRTMIDRDDSQSGQDKLSNGLLEEMPQTEEGPKEKETGKK